MTIIATKEEQILLK